MNQIEQNNQKNEELKTAIVEDEIELCAQEYINCCRINIV